MHRKGAPYLSERAELAVRESRRLRQEARDALQIARDALRVAWDRRAKAMLRERGVLMSAVRDSTKMLLDGRRFR